MTDTAKPGKVDAILNQLMLGLGILMVVFHLINARIYILSSIQFLNIHLMFCFVLVFLSSAVKTEQPALRTLLLVCVVLTVAATLYIHVDYIGIQNRIWANSMPDLVVGGTIIILGLICVKLGSGWFMLCLISVIAIYPLFGQYLPEPLKTRAYSLPQTIGNFCMTLSTGLYSSNLRTSAEYIFLFVVFGSLLNATGVQRFFWELGKILFRKLPSGPSLMATLNCALVGMVTGSALANVMITGPFTIPGMKKAGHTAIEAGAIEAAAATGGQIMPPVMGIVAFAMSSYTGIPYIDIIKMAIVPAIMYYLGIGIYAHYITRRRMFREKIERIEAFSEPVDYRTFFWKMPAFVIPLGVIIVFLANNGGVMEAALWAILTLLAVSMIAPKDLRPDWRALLKGMAEGAKEGAGLGVVIIVCGIITITFTGSGLAVKLAAGITTFSGGTLLGVMLIVWAVTILFGMIGVATVAYYMTAAFAASAMIKMGVRLEVAHFFLMFPCVFNVITPPVALASMVSAKLADGPYIPTAIETCKCAFTGILLPFMVVYSYNGLLLLGSPADIHFWGEIIFGFTFVIAGVLMFVGHFQTKMTWIERLLLGVTFLMSFVWQFYEYTLWIPPVILITIVLFCVLHLPRAARLKHAGILGA
jgi:TRAP transporter 4TM/12TM fusion protein